MYFGLIDADYITIYLFGKATVVRSSVARRLLNLHYVLAVNFLVILPPSRNERLVLSHGLSCTTLLPYTISWSSLYDSDLVGG